MKQRVKNLSKVSPYNGFKIKSEPSGFNGSQKIYSPAYESGQYHNVITNMKNSFDYVKDKNNFRTGFRKHLKDTGFDRTKIMCIREWETDPSERQKSREKRKEGKIVNSELGSSPIRLDASGRYMTSSMVEGRPAFEKIEKVGHFLEKKTRDEESRHVKFASKERQMSHKEGNYQRYRVGEGQELRGILKKSLQPAQQPLQPSSLVNSLEGHIDESKALVESQELLNHNNNGSVEEINLDSQIEKLNAEYDSLEFYSDFWRGNRVWSDLDRLPKYKPKQYDFLGAHQRFRRQAAAEMVEGWNRNVEKDWLKEEDVSLREKRLKLERERILEDLVREKKIRQEEDRFEVMNRPQVKSRILKGSEVNEALFLIKEKGNKPEQIGTN